MGKKKKKDKEEKYVITPKGIFSYVVHKEFGVDLFDKRIDRAWEKFKDSMKKSGYVSK